MDIRKVTVLGANGTMGCNVSAIFASFGNAKVYMIARNLSDAEKARDKAALSVKAEAIIENLIPKTYEDVEECIKESDLVFESVFEDFEIKKDIYARISNYIKPGTIIGSGTSGLSIDDLAKTLGEECRQNFLGIHMYNPPYNMTLCEVIPSNHTNPETTRKVKKYLSDKLFRSVVQVKNEPAFIGNRVGFQFINEAMQYAVRYADKGGIDYIDAIIGPFSGRAMAPLTTSDFVGLDVHKAIVDNIYVNTKDYAHSTFQMPEFANILVEKNLLGRKSGKGLYQLIREDDGSKKLLVYDILMGDYREKKTYEFQFVKEMIQHIRVGDYKKAADVLKTDNSPEALICCELLIKYVLYGIHISKKIGESIYSSDDVMATGFNWMPPLALIDYFGGTDEFLRIAFDRISKDYLSKDEISVIMENVPKSKYDFRPFVKAKR